MTDDEETLRRIGMWMKEGRTALPDQILDDVLEQLPSRPQHGSRWHARRSTNVSTLARFAMAAAAVVVVIVGGSRLLGSPGVGSPVGGLAEGPHLLYDGQTFGAQIIVTIPGPGWEGERDGAILTRSGNAGAPDGAGLLVFAETTRLSSPQGLYIYGDPCHWASTRPGSPVTSVDQAVAALSSQVGRDASAPEDVIVGGQTGKSITLRVPNDVTVSDCDQGEFRTLTQGPDGARSAQQPGQIDKLWILDVDGDVVIIDAWFFQGTPQPLVDELVTIVEGARIQSPS